MGVGGVVGKKTKKEIHAKENAKKKIRAKEKVKKKIHAEGRSNCDFYLTNKICQCLLKIVLIQNIIGASPQALLYYY